MATVTGLTAARMLEIEGQSIVSGYIDGSDHLILVRFDDTEIDAGLISTGDMSLGSNQTVTGIKTFNAGKLMDKGSIVYDVKAFGAVGDNTADDTAAIQAAVDAAQAAGGGIVWFGSSSYKLVTNPIRLYSGSGASLVAYKNITLRGAGAKLNQTSTGIDVIKGLCDPTYSAAASSDNVIIEGLNLVFTGTPTNSGHGIYLARQGGSGTMYNNYSIRNVTATDMRGTGKYGFKFEALTASTIERCTISGSVGGMHFEGSAGGAFGTICTGVTILNCLVKMGTAATNGFHFHETNFMSVIGCKVTVNVNSAGSAFNLQAASATSLEACGIELDGTATLANGYLITEDGFSNKSSNVSLKACFIYASKSTKEVYVTYGCTAVLENFLSGGSVSGSTGLKIDSTAKVIETMCTWSAATGRDFAQDANWQTPGFPRVEAYASSATPTPRIGISDLLNVYSSTTNMTLQAPVGIPIDGQWFEVQYRDSGTARTIGHNAIFQNGAANMVTTTVLGKSVREVFQYNQGSNKWVCMFSHAAGW